MPGPAAACELALALLTIMIAGRLAGAALRHVGQPAALGPVVAGILLGPAVAGELAHALGAHVVLATDASAALHHVGDVGLALFMYEIGLELELRSVTARRGPVVRIAAASVALPFALGAGVGLALAGSEAGPHAGRGAFVLFVATATALTAFPVLAAIVRDQRLAGRPLGELALACAALDDAVGWALLTVALTVAGTGGAADVARALGGTIALVALLAAVVRPLVLVPLARRHGRRGRLGAADLALLLAVAAAAAAASDALGTHVALGAFAAGALTPRGLRGALAVDVRRALARPAAVLVPAGFALPGLTLRVPSLGLGALAELALVTAAASCGKVGGAALAARREGIAPRDALALGALLNARGLVEVVALTAGRAAGLIDARLFAVMLAMALLTTAATVPCLRLLGRTGDGLERT